MQVIIHQEYNDDYSAETVDDIDKSFESEGSYCYINNQLNINMMVCKDDVVIDAGAWIGDFSVLAAYYGATVYAFEPTPHIYKLLEKTAQHNSNIFPIQMGLGSKESELYLYESSNSLMNHISSNGEVKTYITTLDTFVKENNIDKISFIKADIEGAERELLRGATWVMKNYEPKISICTYHLKDDPQVLKEIISKANPKYKFMQRKKKLFAWI